MRQTSSHLVPLTRLRPRRKLGECVEVPVVTASAVTCRLHAAPGRTPMIIMSSADDRSVDASELPLSHVDEVVPRHLRKARTRPARELP